MSKINKDKEKLITKELLDTLFNYNEITGELFWKVSRSNRIKVNQKVNHVSKNGYIQVRINGYLWMVHRLIWVIKTGGFPEKYIDHINGCRTDNSWLNLREVTFSENMQNRKGPDRDNLTGKLGVTFDKQSGKYKAQMIVNGCKVLNKLFNTAQEAEKAYEKERMKYVK